MIDKKVIITKRTVHWDGMCWPRYLENEDDSVQWRIRYNSETKEDLLYAASVMAAYSALVGVTEKRRREIISTLRKAEYQCFVISKKDDANAS